MSSLSKFLAKGRAEQNSMKSSMIRKDNISTWFLIPNSFLQVKAVKGVVKRQNIEGDVMIWGHSKYGIWGDYNYGTVFRTGGFFLNTGVLGTDIIGYVNSEYSTIETNELDDILTISSRNEIRDFLSDISTARNPNKLEYSSGTSAYYFSSTALPTGVLGTGNIGTALRSGTGIGLSSEIYSVNVGTGTVNSVGFLTSSGSILTHYNTLQSSLIMNKNNNYKFTTTFTFKDNSGINSVWTDIGTTYVADWFGGTSNNTPTHIGFGIGTSSINSSHTTLNGEFIRKTISSYSTPFDTVNKYFLSLGIDDGVGTTITRSGIWSAGTADPQAKLLIENKHYSIDKTSLFQIDLEHRNEIE